MNEQLTMEEANTLVCYILSTTQHRLGEMEAWEKLSKETNPDGAPKFKNAAGNAQYYRDLESRLTAIVEKLDRI